ncbi:MAG: hypothetical protein WCN99_06340 [bacterium]
MKVMTDEIIQEVWRAKDLISKSFHYNVDELAAEMRSREKKSSRKFLDLSKDSAQPAVASDEATPRE